MSGTSALVSARLRRAAANIKADSSSRGGDFFIGDLLAEAAATIDALQADVDLFARTLERSTAMVSATAAERAHLRRLLDQAASLGTATPPEPDCSGPMRAALEGAGK